MTAQRKLRVGDVFEADKSLYIKHIMGGGANGEVACIAQDFNSKTRRPTAAPKRHRLEAGAYVVTAVYSETDYTKLYCASPEEREEIIGSYSLADSNVVEAKKLNADGSFDPKGQRITFTQDRDPQGFVRQVNRIGSMRQTFVPVGKLKK